MLAKKQQHQSDDYGKLFEDTDKNIQCLFDRIRVSEFAVSLENDTSEKTSLIHIFSGIRASTVRADLLNFCSIGVELYQSHIQCFITGESSIQVGQKSLQKQRKLHN